MWGRQNYTLRFLRLYWGKNALNTFHTVIYSGGGNVLRISPFFFSSTLSLFHWTHLVSPFLHLIGPAPNYNPHCLLQEIHHIIHAMIIINLKLIADLVGYVGRDHIMETFVSSTSCFLLSHHFWRLPKVQIPNTLFSSLSSKDYQGESDFPLPHKIAGDFFHIVE